MIFVGTAHQFFNLSPSRGTASRKRIKSTGKDLEELYLDKYVETDSFWQW